jgi:hypothetical protein
MVWGREILLRSPAITYTVGIEWLPNPRVETTSSLRRFRFAQGNIVRVESRGAEVVQKEPPGVLDS